MMRFGTRGERYLQFSGLGLWKFCKIGVTNFASLNLNDIFTLSDINDKPLAPKNVYITKTCLLLSRHAVGIKNPYVDNTNVILQYINCPQISLSEN